MEVSILYHIMNHFANEFTVSSQIKYNKIRETHYKNTKYIPIIPKKGIVSPLILALILTSM